MRDRVRSPTTTLEHNRRKLRARTSTRLVFGFPPPRGVLVPATNFINPLPRLSDCAHAPNRSLHTARTYAACTRCARVSPGQVLLREKDRTGTWIIPFRPPDSVPEPPPLQDLVEPKPWRKASEWVCKGDFERAADKSHGATAAAASPLRAAGGGAMSGGSAVASVLRRATSSSSSAASSPLSIGGRLKAKVAGRSVPGATGAAAAAASATTRGTGPIARQSSGTRPPLSAAGSLSIPPPPSPAAAFPSFVTMSPGGVPAAPSPGGHGAGFAPGAAGTTPAIGFASRDKGAAFTFGPPAAMHGADAAAAAAAAVSGTSSDRASPATPQPAVGASTAPSPTTAAGVSPVGGFVFAPRASDSASTRNAQDPPAGFTARGSGTPTSSSSAFAPSGGTSGGGAKLGVAGAWSAAPSAGSGSGAHPPLGVGGATIGGGGAAAVSAAEEAEAARGSSGKKSLLSNFTFTSAPAAPTKSGDSTAPTATGGAGVAAGSANAAETLAAHPQGFGSASGGGFPFAPAANYAAATAAAAAAAVPGTALGVSGEEAAASAAAARQAADDAAVAARAMSTKRQQEDAEAMREKQKQTEEAASKRAAVAAAAKEARRVRDAEGRAMRALSCGKLVPSDVVDQVRGRRSASYQGIGRAGAKFGSFEFIIVRTCCLQGSRNCVFTVRLLLCVDVGTLRCM